MAAFKTHLAGGVLSGASISYAGYLTLGLNVPQLFSIFIMGCLGGILPDLDHDSGKPLTLLFSLVSVLIPALLLDRLPHTKSLSPEFIVTYFVCCYFIINYLICSIIKKITVHRGIMHSIPFAVLFAESAYLLFTTSGRNIAAAIGLSVFVGCITHLILDEFHSVSFKFGFIPTLKRSSGSALKLTSENQYINLLVYCLISAIGYIAITNFRS